MELSFVDVGDAVAFDPGASIGLYSVRLVSVWFPVWFPVLVPGCLVPVRVVDDRRRVLSADVGRVGLARAELQLQRVERKR